eukprot:8063080-Karenia_brevis.AAC.1
MHHQYYIHPHRPQHLQLAIHHQYALISMPLIQMGMCPTMHHQNSLMQLSKLISFSAAISMDGAAMHHQHSWML